MNLQEARQNNNPFYYTGKRCVNGHICIRLTSSKTCYECDKERSRNSTRKNPSRQRDNYYLDNKESILKKQKEYRQDNKGTINAKTRKYQADKIQATPKWADLEAIKLFYINCPKGYQVDHIVPLKNSLVCGLHNQFNLQYLTQEENARKYNKFLVG